MSDSSEFPAARSTAIAQDSIVGAAMTVAHGFSARQPSLGFGSALALRGGSGPDVHRMVLEMDFSWQPALSAVFADALDRSRSSTSPWITTAPVLLLGEKGVGRTHVARRFAHLAGVPHITFDLEDVEVVERLQGVSRGPDVLIPTAPVLAMAASRCANPVVTVVGADTVTEEVQMNLARMIDPSTSDRWADRSVGATVDLRQVSWFVQAHRPELLAAPLFHLLRPIELIWPFGTDRLLHVAEVIAEVMADENERPPTGDHLKSLIDSLHRNPSTLATSALYEAARQALRSTPF